MVEIRDSTARYVQPGLRRLLYDIEEIFKKFDSLFCTGDRNEAELVELQRLGELGLALAPPLNPVSIYSGERSTLFRFLKSFPTRALS